MTTAAIAALERWLIVPSIDEVNENGEGIPHPSTPDPAPALNAALDVERLLEQLEPRDADVIRRRFGVGCAPERLQEIADSLGLCRERIRQLERIALWRMRELAGVDQGPIPKF